MTELVITGRVASMENGAAQEPSAGRVWIRDDQIVAVTKGAQRVSGFSQARFIDTGSAFVLPGFIDMHNHLAYGALSLWSEPGRTEPWLHNKHWTNADTYTESVTEPAWVYAKACPEALLGYVQIRAMAGGATAIQGWPSSNRGYQTILRNVDSEDAGTGNRHLVMTSVVTKTGDALAKSVRAMSNGAGFIYHCAEGQRGSRVIRDYEDLQRSDGLLPTFIGIHCCAVDAERWQQWPKAEAGGIVWSPLSNLVLYGQTTLIDEARARGVRICLGSDWGPSGSRNLLGEMKVARIVADHFGYSLSDAQIIEMVTSNPGVLLERCWHRPVGRLVPGAFADVTVVRGRGRGDTWKRIVAARERDVALVVINGVPRYGDSALMKQAEAPTSFAMTVGGRSRQASLPDPKNINTAWSWTKIMKRLREVQSDPEAAVSAVQARALSGSRFDPDAELELFLDMPDTRRTGRAGPPKNLSKVVIPEVPGIEHDQSFFDQLDTLSIHAGMLDPLRASFGL